MPGTLMRERIDNILEGWGDNAPGTSGNEMIDTMLAALDAGKPNPYAMVNDNGGKRRTPRKVDDYPLVRQVAASLIDLF